MLDAGCGEGYGCRLLVECRRRAPLRRDRHRRATRSHAARTAYGDSTRVEFEAGDVTELPFEDDSFDVVTCFETIEHVGRASATRSRELARVLRPERRCC